jgi:hypothetical protein
MRHGRDSAAGITPFWILMHFGVPDFTGNLNPELLALRGLLQSSGQALPLVRFYTPINDIRWPSSCQRLE